MHVTPGTRLGRYEIVAPLGAGGMGAVYRSMDTHLQREVAIKVLPPDFAADEQWRERFRREARAIAALRHPNICVLHDAVTIDGVDFLVMECIEGQTLAERLRDGPLSWDLLRRCALDVLAGLAAAHAQGIVHRDLKPGNIMLTPAGARLLDFGLAKPQPGLQVHAAGGDRSLTETGMIVGTPGYMAPEQLEAADADVRSDLFAFGAVLYEMATGRKAFDAATSAGIAAAVLTRDPPVDALSGRGLPPRFDSVVMTCVAKDPADRWQSATDIAHALRIIEAEPGIGAAPPRRTGRLFARWLGPALVALVVALGALALRPEPPVRPLRLAVMAPAGYSFTARDVTGHPQFALSPDGLTLAYVAERGSAQPQLWVRSLDSGAERPLGGTEGATGPFWSPDGQQVGFFASGRLRSIRLSGTPPRDLATVSVDVTGGSWSSDGVILIGGGPGGGISRVPAEGGELIPVTVLDTSRAELGHRLPQFLPDGRRFLYYARGSAAEDSGVFLASLDAPDQIRLLASPASAVFVEPSDLLYELNGTLVRHAIDLGAGALVGDPVPLGDPIRGLLGPGHLPLSVSRTGTMAYWNGSPPLRELNWIDREGRPLGTVSVGSGFTYEAPAISSDGRFVLASVRSEQNRMMLWKVDLASGTAERLPVPQAFGNFGVWSPDGSEIATSSAGVGGWHVVRISASGGGDGSRVGDSPQRWGMFPDDWSADGRWIVYGENAPTTGWSIAAVDLATGESLAVVTGGGWQTHGRLSPDGRFLGYASDESGRWEAYVVPFPRGTGKWQISDAGGSRPIWSPDGRQIYYVDADGRIVSVSVSTEPAFATGLRRVLFSTRVGAPLMPHRAYYDIHPDGERFLVAELAPGAQHTAITIVVNWRSGL